MNALDWTAVDAVLVFHAETELAWLVSIDSSELCAVWRPKSLVLRDEHLGPSVWRCTLPAWAAHEIGARRIAA